MLTVKELIEHLQKLKSDNFLLVCEDDDVKKSFKQYEIIKVYDKYDKKLNLSFIKVKKI